MILERYLIREIAHTLTGVMVILALIVLSGSFLHILASAIEGDYPARLVFSLLGLEAVGKLMFILPLSFYFSILLALGRLYNDSEMTALFACGVEPRRIYRAITALGLSVAAVVAFFSLYMTPKVEDISQQLLDEAKAEVELAGLVPGHFNEAGDTGPLVYVEALDEESGVYRNLFAQARVNGRLQLLSAQRAYQRIDESDGSRYLVLEEGYRYEGKPGEAGFRIIHFQTHGLRIEEREVEASQRPRHALTTAHLWGSNDRGDKAELHWRITMPITAFLLALLAVPLSKSDPRKGRNLRLFTGVLAYFIYSNLLTVGRSWIASGEVPQQFGLWWVHALLVLMIWFSIKSQNSLKPAWSWRRRRSA